MRHARTGATLGAAHRLPYARQSVDEDDIQAVVAALRSDYLTTGPLVERFEAAVAEFAGAGQAVALSSGTAGLHAAMHAAGVGLGDEVIVPPLTFVATANAVLYQGGVPVFADVEPGRLVIDPAWVEAAVTPRTKAIVAVDYAGHPCDYDALRAIAQRHQLVLVADAAHALGAVYRGRKAGTLADMTVFSFHPVKHITTGEGGMLLTDDARLAARARRFRNHGISADHWQRAEQGTWHYEVVDLGYNYRLSDLQCALGLSQLAKLPAWLTRRREIAARYDAAYARLPGVAPQAVSPGVSHAYHLYVVLLDPQRLGADRAQVFDALRRRGIGVNVHYMPVHLHPYYRQRFGYRGGEFPVAEAAYERLITLPMFPAMSDGDVARVIEAVTEVLSGNAV